MVEEQPLNRLIKAVIAQAFKDLRWRNPELQADAETWLVDERTVALGRECGMRWQLADIAQAVAQERERKACRNAGWGEVYRSARSRQRRAGNGMAPDLNAG